MSRVRIIILCLTAAAVVFVGGTTASAQSSASAETRTQSAPANNHQVVSLGDELRRKGNEPPHLLYIHGIGATGPGDSQELRESLCKNVKKYIQQECIAEPAQTPWREYADEGIFDIRKGPPDLTYMGARIWGTAEEWRAAAPFVDHYVIRLTGGKSILVDEINWWPMVFASKCRHIMPNETDLAGKLTGRATNFLAICSREQPHQGDGVEGRFDSYNWLKAAGLDAGMLNAKPNRAVPINRWVKVQIMDWNFSDAVLGVGPMEGYLVEGIRQLLTKCVVTGSETTARLTAKTVPMLDPDADFITVSHSLGSFLLFSALHAEYGPVGREFGGNDDRRVRIFDYLLGHLSQAYFFANQIPLLELGKLGTANSRSFLDLRTWSEQRRLFKAAAGDDGSKPLGQVVAWSDANDLLTWYLGSDFQTWQTPPANRIRVVNNIVRNATTWNWLWLFENPEHAHNDYAKNPKVIRALLRPLE